MAKNLLRTITVLISLTAQFSHQTNLTLISVSMQDDGREGFWNENPVYQVIMEMTRESNPALFENFSHISLRYLYDRNFSQITLPMDRSDVKGARNHRPPPTPLNCEVGDVSDYFFDFYYHNLDLFTRPLSEQFTIITASDCNAVDIEISRFLPEVNVLMLISVPEIGLSNNLKYPATINMFSMPDEYFVYTVAVLCQTFGWSGFNLLCNKRGGFTFNMCEQFEGILRTTSAKNLEWSRFDGSWDGHEDDSTSIAPDFSDVFPRLASKRVTVAALDPPLLRKFMLAAYDWNLTNGDYVFFTFGIQGTPKINTIYWKMNRDDDEKAYLAFQSLLVIADSTSDWNGTYNLSKRINEEYRKQYNWTLSIENQDIATPVKFFEVFAVFAQTFARVHQNLDRMKMTDFVKECSNRSYDLPTRTVFLDQFGAMAALVSVTRINPSGLFETVMKCNLNTPNISILALDWFGQNTLPGDLPYCGLRGENCLYTREPGSQLQFEELANGSVWFDDSDLTNIGIPIICVGLTLLLLFAVGFARRMVLENRLAYLILNPNKLVLFGSSLDKMLDSEGDKDLMGVPGLFTDKPVYVKELVTGVSLQRLTRNRAFANGLVSLSLVRHQYLAEFFGISMEKLTCNLIFERPVRKSLKFMLSTSEIFQDLEIRISLMESLIEGLCFLHTSDLKYHGALSSDYCLLNDRYTIRIVQAGFLHLLSLLGGPTREVKGRCGVIGAVDNVTVTLHYQQEDIRDLGLILVHMFTTDHSKEAEDGPPQNTWGAVQEMITQCLSSDASARPTAMKLKHRLRKMGFSGKNIVQLLLDGLQKHSLALEELILQRSTVLLEEMRKVDNLLLEMLPQSVIRRLRDREPIEAELFESVTILFSDIPVFGRIVAECAPMEVVSCLNQIHTAFDNVVAQFDVYKVETINDSYVVASGVPVRNGLQHAVEICKLALRLIVAGNSITVPSWGEVSICPRLGINSGYVAAGVAGARMPRYCLFGDTMNTASRMESHGEANRIHVSKTTQELVLQISTFPPELVLIPRGFVAIKGKGLVETFWLQPAALPQGS